MNTTQVKSVSAPVVATAPPAKLLVAYVPTWLGAPELLPRLININQAYNVLILCFAVRPAGTTSAQGTVTWPGFESYANANGVQTYLVPDIATCRSRKQKILVSVGGEDGQVLPTTRDQSQAFVDSITTIYHQLGAIDGIDLDTYEGSSPNLAEYTWICTTLKSTFGASFLITTPPAPWNAAVDQPVCVALLQAGALDLVMPQYYGGPNLATASYMEGDPTGSVARWRQLVGDAHLVPLFGIDPTNTADGEYATASDAAAIWATLRTEYPQLAGCGLWHMGKEIQSGYAFASKIT